MLRFKNKGSLEVICGPMFSGKSEELIRRIRRAKIARQKVMTFKHRLDDRHHSEYVVSHDGNKVEAHPLDQVEKILEMTLNQDVEVIGIDEAQFFSQDIVPIICTLVESGKRVIIAGLDLDFRATPFGCMPILLAIADKVIKLCAICTECGDDASLTQRLVNGFPAKFSDPIIMPGAQEFYQARCRDCYSIDRKS
jgi:thymidine kinase